MPTAEATKIGSYLFNTAKNLNLPFIETSARDGNNVEEAYIQMGKIILDSRRGNNKLTQRLS